jgi:hypothetical protein
LRSVHWSPDGQRLAYVRVQRTPENYLTLMETCDLKGANQAVVVPGTDLFLNDFLLAFGRGDRLFAAGVSEFQ